MIIYKDENYDDLWWWIVIMIIDDNGWHWRWVERQWFVVLMRLVVGGCRGYGTTDNDNEDNKDENDDGDNCDHC